MSIVSGRRLEANWTRAMDPAIRSAQNDSVRSVRAQLNSRGGGMRLAIRSDSRCTAGAGSSRRDPTRTPRETRAGRRTRRTPARAPDVRPHVYAATHRSPRSEERRVGKEGRSRRSQYHTKKKKKMVDEKE